MKSILVPTDFSPAADNALHYALKLAALFGTPVVLLHVYNADGFSFAPRPALSLSGDGTILLDAAGNDHYNMVSDKLQKLRETASLRSSRPPQIECMALEGNVHDGILSMAGQLDAGAIVMGMRNKTDGFGGQLASSLAMRIARNESVPVFIIPETVRYRPVRKISFACDLKHPDQARLAHTAKYFSRLFGAELEIVNVEQPGEDVSDEKTFNNFFMEDVLENIRHSTIHITGSDVAHELEEYFKMFDTGLVMLSPRKHNLLYYLFHSSITSEIVHHINLPVLAVH